MIGFISKLDEWTNTVYAALDRKIWGFCELAHRTVDNKDQPTVMTVNGTSDRENVTLDDRYQLITWFRIVNSITLSNEISGNDWAFGFDSGHVQKGQLRWVIAHIVELGEELIYNFARQIPDKFTINGYQVAFVDRESVSIDHDHETIYRTELGDTVYEKHRFPWNIYVVTFDVEYILNPLCTDDQPACEDCPPISFITQDGDCLIPN